MRQAYIGLLFLLVIPVFSHFTYAQEPMEAGSFKIEQGQVDLQNNQGQANTSPQVKTLGSFLFSISESLIDFGNISPTNPLVRKNTIKISSTQKYFLKTYEDHQLISPRGDSIPDATCDSGSCSEQTPDDWKSVLTYGFGFRCDSKQNNCGQEFLTDTAFSQFANKSRNEPYNSLLSGTSGKNQINITYKLNISSGQKPGAYTNTVTMLLLPSY